MSDRVFAIAIVLFVAFVGVALRILGMQGDIWFDEAWTLETLRRFEYPAQMLSTYHHHTNHLLNTVIMSALPPLLPDMVYRIPAACAAIASLPLFWVLAQRQSGHYSLSACLLYALSVVVIAFGTESRGYGLMLFFALTAFLSLDANLRQEDWRWIGIYWISATLAFLAHPTFAVFFSALIFWSLCLDMTSRLSRTVEILGKCHLVPVALCAVIYLRFYHYVPPASLGAPQPFVEAIISAASLAVGGPEYLSDVAAGVSLARLLAGVVGILVCVEVYLLVVSGSRYWGVYLAGIFVAPFVWYLSPLVRTNSSAYFLMPIVLTYVVLGNFVFRLASQGFVGRTIAALMMGLYCFGNVDRLQDALEAPRGKVRRAFEYMAENSQGPEISLAGDDDLGNELFIGFYLPRLALSKSLIYRVSSEKAAADAEWYLVRRDKLSHDPDLEVVLGGGREFQLKKIFRRTSPAGTNLYLYQRAME